MNETIINMTVNTLDIGEKSMSCLHNGALNDQCLYKMLCGQMNEYFIYAGIGLLLLDFAIGIIEFIYKRKFKNDRLKVCEFLYRAENLVKFGFMIYVIVVLYYNIL